MTTHRPLAELMAVLDERGLLVEGRGGAAVVAVGGVALDSREVAAGDLFVAISGARDDGLRYAANAVARGAAALITDRPTQLAVPEIIVTAPRTALAVAAAWFYGNPSHELGVVGVTGTDGKTTTSFMTRSMLAAAGLPAGMITTVTALVGGQSAGYQRQTTPESPGIQRYLRQMVEAGDRFAVVESTSHGLAMERVAEVAYDVAVLTNVTHEHLDLHGTIEKYVEAKTSLFDRLAVGPRNPDKSWPKAAIVNAADQHAPDFIAAAEEAGARLITYAADGRTAADVVATEVDAGLGGVRVRVRTSRWDDEIQVELAGAYNAENILAAVSVGEALGLDPVLMRTGISNVRAVPGRMERINLRQPFDVFVDFAHTAAALELVIDTLTPEAAKRGGGVVVVFGSSGERDVQKRPMMGRVAGLKAKAAVITNEEPRGEDEMLIIEQIAAGAEAAGMKRDHDLFLIADRRAAIQRAFELAQPTDVVVLCGKGHETTMEMSFGTVPWNEAEIARDTLRAMGYGR